MQPVHDVQAKVFLPTSQASDSPPAACSVSQRVTGRAAALTVAAAHFCVRVKLNLGLVETSESR